ncbi:MAG: DNA repair protein RadA [Bacteroidales bacterium]|nr:DNA repair protein RadA [Bacteroidales bacterium]
MAKQKTQFVCAQCGYESPKWLGKCPSCSSWNSFIEETRVTGAQKLQPTSKGIEPVLLQEVTAIKVQRTPTGIGEFDRVLGGGFVPGSLVLLGGEPGIGKSTLAIESAHNLANKDVLYISGEESMHQVKARSERLKNNMANIYLWPETNLESIANHLKTTSPALIIIDSIQTLFYPLLDTAPGSLVQVRECTFRLGEMAREKNIPILLIGHINKEGSIAGPKVLEHMVDVVLQFEGDAQKNYRILRSYKNRYGSTAEMGLFEMTSGGLKEITNPSEVLLNQFHDSFSGIAVGCSIDGNRPMLTEVQALVSSAVYGTPQRSVTGYDVKRLNMLLAVLERRAGFKLSFKDVFLNLAGGIKVSDPALDLATVAAILSSNFDLSISHQRCFAAEVGLSGEIRPVNRTEVRVNEAVRHGFKEIFVSGFHKDTLKKPKGIEVVELKRIEDLVKKVFG